MADSTDFTNFNGLPPTVDSLVVEKGKVHNLYVLTESEASNAFIEFASREGFQIPADITMDGRIHRFSTGDRGDKDGWCFAYYDRFSMGVVGCWRTGREARWYSNPREGLQPSERDAVDRMIERNRAKMIEIRLSEHSAAAAIAKVVMDTASGVPPDHPYVAAKQVYNPGLRIAENGAIAIPVHDFDGTVSSLQYIFPDGTKRFLTNGEIRGRFFQIGPVGDRTPIAICEGWATGQTIHTATGWPVFCTFSTSNLRPAGERIRAAYPLHQIVVCADNDAWTSTPDGSLNPGVTKAREVAAAIRANVIAPVFRDTTTRPTDYNDLMRLEGIDAVRAQLIGPQAPRAIKFDVASLTVPGMFSGPAPKIDWLVNGVFQAGQVGIIAAMGDIGKGMLMLDLALKVAGPGSDNPLDPENQAFGNQISRHGRVVYLTAEDSRDEVHRRLCGIDPSRRWESYSRLHVIPLAAYGGPFAIVQPGRNGPEASAAFLQLREDLLKMDGLTLITFDPLASFCSADINSDPAVGAFMTGLLASLAEETGATVLLVHHLGKGSADKPINSPEQARHAVRGSTAIVDGVRLLYCLWLAEVSRSKVICQQLGVKYQRNCVVFGAVCKANGPADRSVKTMCRAGSGLLHVVDDTLAQVEPDEDALVEALFAEISEAAEDDMPYTRTSKGDTGDGLKARATEFKDRSLRLLSRPKLCALADRLLEEGRVVLASAPKGGSTKKYLVPAGSKWAMGNGTVAPGARERCKCN